jgi:hypothetical protein
VQIKATFPWFFEIRELIGERPNLTPTGLGNSTTSINLSEGTDLAGGNSDSEDDPGTRMQMKRKAGSDSNEASDDEGPVKDEEPIDLDTAHGQTASQTRKSMSITTKKGPGKKKGRIEEFADLAHAEEITRQKELEISKLRAERALAEAKAKAELRKVKVKAQHEKNQQHAQLRELKLKQDHDIRL